MLTGWGLLSAQRQESEEARVVVGHIRQLQVRRGEESEGRSCSQVMESFACWLDEFEPHCTGSEELWIAFELRSSCSRLIWGQCGEGSGRNGMTVGAVRDWGSCMGGEDALVPVPRSALSTMAVMAVRRGSQQYLDLSLGWKHVSWTT